VVGHWQDEDVLASLDDWSRAAARRRFRKLKIARFGGMNMREVAVTEATARGADQVRLAVNGYGVGDRGAHREWPKPRSTGSLEYEDLYTPRSRPAEGGEQRANLRDAARQEIGIAPSSEGVFDRSPNVRGSPRLKHSPARLPAAHGRGLRLRRGGRLEDGRAVRLVKVMSAGRPGGVSFMEDYTYHWPRGASECSARTCRGRRRSPRAKPSLEVHPLDIGGKADPCRLVFDAGHGPAVNVTLVDMGGRMRMIVNEDGRREGRAMPKLPPARRGLGPPPDCKRGCAGWILAGGAPTPPSARPPPRTARDLAGMLGVELIPHRPGTDLGALKNELRWNDAAYRIGR